MHFSGNVDPSLKSLPPEPKEIIEMVRNSFEKPPKKIKNGKLTYEYVDKGGSGAIYKVGSGSTAYVLKVFRHPSLTESEIRNGSYLRDNKIYKDCAEYIDGDAQLGYLRMEYISRTKPIKIADREGITLKQGKVWLDDAKPANFIPVRDGKIRVDYDGTMIVGGEDQTPMNQEQGGRAVYW